MGYVVISNHPITWDGVSNHQPQDYLLNRLFRRRSKNTSKLRVTGLCAGNSPVTGEFPAQGPVTRKIFPFDDVIMPPWTKMTTIDDDFESGLLYLKVFGFNIAPCNVMIIRYVSFCDLLWKIAIKSPSYIDNAICIKMIDCNVWLCYSGV